MKNYLLVSIVLLFLQSGCKSSEHYDDSLFNLEEIDKNKQTLVLSSIIWTKKGSYYYNNELMDAVDLERLKNQQIKSMEVIHDTLHIITF
ncbi:hypothetical protein [Flammeovirga aprica]|uniref:Uncharacterized protein n=1 Tax=Flammeovirga aprica JL-4 TaxID=694437 RepID=A0A7X9RUW8_9BACT|nr:hypothetical protein [Flammeovirga aprica]NME69157.1 hypothetical protein [Flammeovirga aprica JL-4]